MLLDGRVDAAAIDSNVLQYFLLEHPEYKDRLHVMTSVGPLPAPPVVVNSRMNGKQGLHPANERRRYKVTPSLIGWVQT